jgi:hypothetical protein
MSAPAVGDDTLAWWQREYANVDRFMDACDHCADYDVPCRRVDPLRDETICCYCDAEHARQAERDRCAPSRPSTPGD